VIIIAPYRAEQHRQGIREMLRRNGWEAHYVCGQLAGIDVLTAGPLPGMRCGGGSKQHARAGRCRRR